MKTIIEFFEKVDNYSDCYGIWAKSLDPNSEVIVGQMPNNPGGYLEFVALDGWIYLGTIQQIMDARLSWHEGLADFDPFFVDDYLSQDRG